MKTIGEALSIMLPYFSPLPAERVSLLDGLGRHLYGDIAARGDLPELDNSAMDGYALRFDPGLSIGDVLPVVGEARAGGPMAEPLSPGSAARIFTGAPLPAGADTVLMQENCERIDRTIRLTALPRARGQHVRSRGSDVRAQERLLGAGHPLGAGELSLLAAQGWASIDVHRRPRVAIISTGDELRDIGQPGEPGTIVNTNLYGLSAQVTEAGGLPWVLPTAPDDVDAIAATLQTAGAADVIVSAGGVSVGEYDLVGKALTRAGVTTHFWKVAIKPGKPVLFGTLEQTPVLGLPGNPVSAMATFELFVRPGLRRMAGSPTPYRAITTVALGHDHQHSPGRTELARARVDHGSTPPRVILHDTQGSGSLRSMCDVHALVVLPAEQRSFAAGEHLQAMLLPAGRHQAACPFDGGDA